MALAPADPVAGALRKMGTVSGAGQATQALLQKRVTTRLDPLWSVHLKDAAEAAVRELQVEILTTRLVHVYDATDRDMALFELESSRGLLHAILSRTGTYSFFWKR